MFTSLRDLKIIDLSSVLAGPNNRQHVFRIRSQGSSY